MSTAGATRPVLDTVESSHLVALPPALPSDLFSPSCTGSGTRPQPPPSSSLPSPWGSAHTRTMRRRTMDSWIHELDCYTVSSAPGWSLDIGPPGPPASPLWHPMPWPSGSWTAGSGAACSGTSEPNGIEGLGSTVQPLDTHPEERGSGRRAGSPPHSELSRCIPLHLSPVPEAAPAPQGSRASRSTGSAPQGPAQPDWGGCC